jgi:hypothetical protein
MKDEKFFASIQFPFTDPSSIDAYTRLTNKILGAAMKEKMEESPMGAMGQSPDITSINDYYELHFENGQLKKSLNKKKYADLDNDEYLKGLKDAAGKGLPVTSTHIINLPSPATKVEGKNVSLSDDKRKVTVKVSIEDLFDDPEKLEFKIKY